MDKEKKTTLIQKNPAGKKPAPNNYGLIMMKRRWKILTAPIREDIYNSLLNYKCHKGMRGIGDLLHSDQHILKRDGKCCNVVVELQQRIRYGLGKLDKRLFQNVQYSRQSHKVHHGNHEKLDNRRNNSAEVKNHRGIFQGDRCYHYYL